MEFKQATVNKGYFGLSGTGALITGMASGDIGLRTAQSIFFSTDGGTTAAAKIAATTGVATFTPTTVFSNSVASLKSNLVAPTSFTFPATTVNWTNPLTCNIEVYIDNFGVTGTVVKKNGGQISSGISQFMSFGLQSGEYFSETYTVGSPTGTYSPF